MSKLIKYCPFPPGGERLGWGERASWRLVWLSTMLVLALWGTTGAVEEVQLVYVGPTTSSVWRGIEQGLREANILLQEVLSGATANLTAVENTLSGRVKEFVITMNQLADRSGATSSAVEEQMRSFHGTTSTVLRDITQLAERFDEHGRALATAAEVIESSNHRTEQSIPAADEDYFRDMDDGLKLTLQEIRGRNTWIVWTGGNDRSRPRRSGAVGVLSGVGAGPHHAAGRSRR